MPTRVPDKSIPEPWLSFLGELDAAVETEVRLDCMGGFVVTVVYGFSRPTADLDVLEIAPREAGKLMLQLGMKGGPLHKKCKIYLDPVGVSHVPESYEELLVTFNERDYGTVPERFGIQVTTPRRAMERIGK